MVVECAVPKWPYSIGRVPLPSLLEIRLMASTQIQHGCRIGVGCHSLALFRIRVAALVQVAVEWGLGVIPQLFGN